LQAQRPQRLFLAAEARRSRSLQVDILVNDLAVVHDLDEAGTRDLLALFIKARGAENDVERLPFAGLLRRVDARRGMVVNAAAVAGVQLFVLLAVAVADSPFVLAT